MTRSAFASREGSLVLSVAGVPGVSVLDAVSVAVPAAVVVVVDELAVSLLAPPQAVTSRAAEPMAAAAPSARLCI